jgi:hypothetical protein
MDEICWELFSGRGGLSAAVVRLGVPAREPVDLVFGPLQWNLLDDSLFAVNVTSIVESKARTMHLGTPCTSFSMALRGAARKRSTFYVVGPETTNPKIATANKLVRRTVELCTLIASHGGWWSVENPLSSLMLKFPGVDILVSQN